MTPSGGKPAPVLGILGGVAAGKSTVSEMLARRGARVIDADRIAHAVLTRPQVKRAVATAFGQDVMDDTGQISRPRLGRLTFESTGNTEKLNRIVHGPILEEIRTRVEALRREEGVPVIVLDAPLLIETGLHEGLCDALLFVDAPCDQRRERAGTARKMGPEQFERRSRAQMPVEGKRASADFIIDNSQSLKDLEKQVEGMWPRLCATDSRPED